MISGDGTFFQTESPADLLAAVAMSVDKGNKDTFPVFKKLAFGILLTLGANAIFLTISFTVRAFPVCAGELVLSKGILQVRVY